MFSITFLGATETVTGSKFLVQTPKGRVLVDCGLFQGLKPLRLRNREPLALDAASLDAVVLTHAHLDHSGYVPALVKAGFTGPVYCTPATRALAALLLPDAGYLQEEEARYRNAHGTTKHHPALPLFTAAEAERCLKQLQTLQPHEDLALTPDLTLRFSQAGHIPGAACVHLNHRGTRLVFTGDVGRPNDPIMRPPEPLEHADYLVLECTYGNRRHGAEDPKAALKEVVSNAAAKKGVVLIPAFAVGRAQVILHLLAELRAEGEIPDIPIYLNSPMAINATKIFHDFPSDHRLTPEQSDNMHREVRYVREADASRALNQRSGPMVIVSASGMAAGGRILHHIKAFGDDEKNTILFIGYQAAGTRGEAMLAGASEVKIHGEYVPIRAKVMYLDSLSAHADYRELLDWLSTIKTPPKKTFLVHGEPSSLDSMRLRLRDALGWDAVIPAYKEMHGLD